MSSFASIARTVKVLCTTPLVPPEPSPNSPIPVDNLPQPVQLTTFRRVSFDEDLANDESDDEFFRHSTRAVSEKRNMTKSYTQSRSNRSSTDSSFSTYSFRR